MFIEVFTINRFLINKVYDIKFTNHGRSLNNYQPYCGCISILSIHLVQIDKGSTNILLQVNTFSSESVQNVGRTKLTLRGG